VSGVARGQEHLSMLRSLGLRSAVIVPLIAKDQRLGAITFVSAESARRFTEVDLPFAEDLGARAATAAQNARLYEELRKANEAKDRFIAVLSHELRTPLNPVLMTVSDLENDQRLPTDVREQLGVVRRNVDLEARLIDDLLDSTRIATGSFSSARTTCSHRRVDRSRCCLSWKADARLKSIQLEVTKSCGGYHVDGDPARLQQVIWNLLKERR
jgi:signal transduction histidine kinase